MKRLRGVLERHFDRGAFDSACREIRALVPIDQLCLARAADDGSHFELYVTWTSREIRVPAVKWGHRIERSLAFFRRRYACGRARLHGDLASSPLPVFRGYREAGLRWELSVPLGRPLVGMAAFGFAHRPPTADETRLRCLRCGSPSIARMVGPMNRPIVTS